MPNKTNYACNFKTTARKLNRIKIKDVLDKANEQGIKFALSNVFEHKGKKNKILQEWAKKYKVYEIDSNYSNCSYQKKDKEAITREVLVVNY